MTTVGEMRRERDRLDAAIRREEKLARTTWNDRMDDLEAELRKTGLAVGWLIRKNEVIGTLCDGGEVRLRHIEEHYGAWLQIKSPDGYTVQWDGDGVPDTEKFLRVVRAVAS